MLGSFDHAPQTGLAPRKRGPEKSILAKLLESFYKIKKESKVNKANFLIYLLRSFKKILKNSSDLKSANIKILEEANKTQLELELKSFDTVGLLQFLSGQPINIETCVQFFLQDEVKRLYVLIINQVLGANKYLLIIERLNLRCCLSGSHTNDCYCKLLYLANHLSNHFLSDLESDNQCKKVKRSRSSSPSNFLNSLG